MKTTNSRIPYKMIVDSYDWDLFRETVVVTGIVPYWKTVSHVLPENYWITIRTENTMVGELLSWSEAFFWNL